MKHTLESIKKLLLRDLNKLTDEISAYPTEESLWVLKGEIKNTAGNLCLHLCGNLQHYIGSVLDQSGYVRNREAEFANQHIPKEKLLAEVEATKKAVADGLDKIDPAKLAANYPVQVFGEPMTTEYFLIHLSGHLTYHLGQINYHRRILAG